MMKLSSEFKDALEACWLLDYHASKHPHTPRRQTLLSHFSPCSHVAITGTICPVDLIMANDS
jgi:hypothetical protein